MRKLRLFSAVCALAATSFAPVSGQNFFPNWVAFQAVARDAAGQTLASQSVDVRFTLRSNGTAVYCETHTLTTNAFGSFTAQFGRGQGGGCNSAPNTPFTDLTWTTSNRFIQVEFKPTTSSNYTDLGTTELATVPYALSAKKAEAVSGIVLAGATAGQVLAYNASTSQWEPATPPTYTAGSGITISGNTISALPTVYTAGNGISISGNTISSTAPTYSAGSGISIANNVISATGSGSTYTAGSGISITGNAISATDASATNELQNLTVTGTRLAISNGNSVQLPNTSPWATTSSSGIYNTNSGGVGIGRSPRNGNALDVRGVATVNNNGIYKNMLYGDAVLIQDTTGVNQIGMSTSGKYVGVFATDGQSLVTQVSTSSVFGGYFGSANSSGQENVRISQLSTNANNGFISVGNSTTSKAGIYVDANDQGTIFGDVKNFRMAHPTQPGKEIWYASLEGPEAGAYSRGTATLVNGECSVRFADHFALVANPTTMTVVLTPGSADSKGLAVIEKTAEGFKVKELARGTGSYSFDWEVKAVRKNYENYRVIRDASEMATNGPAKAHKGK